MRILLLLSCAFLTLEVSQAQDRSGHDKSVKDSLKKNELNEVVVTGQYQPQSLRNSVYQTRIITAERIRLRASGNIQQVLSTELGFRFSNDFTVGTSDVQLMGMSGRNVKILLDGVPMIDRTDTRESLNQIDINTVERIEIVEGPLSVSYGSDALAGVINIITKGAAKSTLNVNARVQEETVGGEYSPFSKSGSHIQHIGIGASAHGFTAQAGLTHNDFNGFAVPGPLLTAAEIAAVANRWKPKEQWLANTRLAYRTAKLNIWYRLDYLDETIDAKGGYNPLNYTAINQTYITNRYTQQLQSVYRLSDKLQFTGVIGYSNLKRATTTLRHDYSTGEATLTDGLGEQDISKFRSGLFRGTVQYKATDQVSFQPGFEINLDGASGARIAGSPAINDYALFVSAEINLVNDLTIRPGLRFIENSVYDAPPVIPSINTRYRLSSNFDLRLGYANGFRSPALRELYYDFIDANHKILGNPNLKAEQSDSFTASITFTDAAEQEAHFRSVLSTFYNKFRNKIDFGQSAADITVTTPLNIANYKTLGGTFENTFYLRNLQASVGVSYIGYYNQYQDSGTLPGEQSAFSWSPEINSNISYTFPKWNTTLNLSYKFTGKQPIYSLYTPASGIQEISLAKTGSFHMADLMLTKQLFKVLSINAGVKNLFDVTYVSNSTPTSTAAHSTGSGPLPVNYGRSYLLGLIYNWNIK
jgi:outer membrane receptor for ferrienterochelin and colicins